MTGELHDPGPLDEGLEPSADELARDRREELEESRVAELEKLLERPEAPGQDGPDPDVADPGLVSIDEAHRGILEDNGFNAIQTSARQALAAIGALPVQALDAAIAYHELAIARLKLNPDPQAIKLVPSAEANGDYLRLTRRFRKELGEREERLVARARILGQNGTAE